MLIKCTECGKEISDQATACPNCGRPLKPESKTQINNNEQEKPQKPQKMKNSTLSTLSAIFAFFTFTLPIGVILAIIDLAKKDKTKKHTGSWFAIIFASIFFIIIITPSKKEDSKNNQQSNSNTEQRMEDIQQNADDEKTETENETAEIEEIEEAELKIGSSFEKSGLRITINDASLDFSDYSDEYGFYTPADGMKYIMVSFTFENTGSSDAYVSIYDFDCYADNTACEQAYLPDGSDFINTNLSSGRNISFKTYYSVPVDAKSIELEYETNIWTGEKAIIKLQ